MSAPARFHRLQEAEPSEIPRLYSQACGYLRTQRQKDYSHQFVGIPTAGPYKDARVYCDTCGAMFLVINGTKAYLDLPDYSFRKVQSPMIRAIRRTQRNRATLTFLQEIVLPLAVLCAMFHFLYYVSITVQ